VKASVPITPLQIFWGVLALVGLVMVGLPALHAPDQATFLAAVTGNWSTLTVSLDLLGLGLAATAFAVIQSHRVGMRWPWIWVPLAIPLPGAFLVPLFFLLRERTLLRRSVERAG
jgi:hypothetical protein